MGNMWSYRSTYTCERVKELTASLQEWIERSMEQDETFLFKRWAFANGVNPSRISSICEIDEDFARAFAMAKAWQEFRLEEDTLYKKTEYRMAMAMLSAHHGWKTKDENENRLGTLANDFGKFLEYMSSQKKPEQPESDPE